ncbi:unnamed protein product [Rotaria sp. Silwood1]|nr:unnamed protein product [Rotaria sp. Silwood1]CAF3383895.1 unnamed protein product [Rotaria sp. Silwood1]CAF4543640.1 unnamed protein product [Rotaria sp. Silwood1]CAF4655135.1 unnamed protein product [Rotaria sp. Silwood1]
MLPEFRSQFFQLPLISTTWAYTRNRYIEVQKNSFFPVRFLLFIIERTILLIYENIIRPLLNPCYPYVNKLDQYLCSHIDSIRNICPIIDHTSDEVIERYSDLFFLSFTNKNMKSSTVNNNSNNVNNIHEEKRFKFNQPLSQFLTNILMMIENYSKYIHHELNSHIDRYRNLWKKLNMEDGRSLDEVNSFSEKLLVLGRRMTGNYRQFVYLIRYQMKRCRSILFSFLHFQKRFRSILWRFTRKIRMNENLNDRARYGLVISKERIHRYLEIIMLHATKHPWMRWRQSRLCQVSESQLERPLKFIHPMFFLSSNSTSDCSGSEDNRRDEPFNIFQSTPYRKNYKYSNVIQSKAQFEDVLSDISSSLSSTSEQSFDVRDIVRQVGSQYRQLSDTSSSTDQDDENLVIEQALNETDDDEQHEQSVSVFDLSPMLASGCAV